MTALLALLLAAAPDAGVPVVAARDGGVAVSTSEPKKTTTSSGSEVEKLKKEVAELRSKVSELESKHADELGKLNKRVEKMQSWMDAEDERRENEVHDAERRRANAAEVQNTLNVALTQLASGNTNNLERWLRSAEGIATADSAKWIAVARQAIAQNDLVSARQALVLAISTAQ